MKEDNERTERAPSMLVSFPHGIFYFLLDIVIQRYPAAAAAAAAAAKLLQSCPTLCDPIDGSPPGSPVPGILQARTLVSSKSKYACKWFIPPLATCSINTNCFVVVDFVIAAI